MQGRFIEPFIGGGAVFFDQEPSCGFIGDCDEDLMNFYSCVAEEPRNLRRALLTFEDARLVARACSIAVGAAPDLRRPELETIIRAAVEAREFPPGWNAVRVAALAVAAMSRSSARSAKRQGVGPDAASRMETAFQFAVYACARDEQRPTTAVGAAARFFYLREFCFGGMFRTNRAGDFNVPYGGRSYNRRNFARKVAAATSEQARDLLSRTRMMTGDFRSTLERAAPCDGDFVFLDPPYDCAFNDYGSGSFDAEDHREVFRLFDHAPCNMLLVTQATSLTETLAARACAASPELVLTSYKARYAFSARGRNSRAATHLLLRNY